MEFTYSLLYILNGCLAVWGTLNCVEVRVMAVLDAVMVAVLPFNEAKSEKVRRSGLVVP